MDGCVRLSVACHNVLIRTAYHTFTSQRWLDFCPYFLHLVFLVEKIGHTNTFAGTRTLDFYILLLSSSTRKRLARERGLGVIPLAGRNGEIVC